MQAFVSEYAVTGDDAGMGSLLASLAEAAFLLGIEKNRFANLHRINSNCFYLPFSYLSRLLDFSISVVFQWHCFNGKLCATFRQHQWHNVPNFSSFTCVNLANFYVYWHWTIMCLRWKPDAIVFNSHQAYGTPSYWMQHFFIDSGGANFLTSTLNTTSPSLIASAITYSADGKNFLKIKVPLFCP